MNIIDYITTQGAIEFLKTQPIKKVYLFGSHSREESTNESDFDFLIDLDEKVDLFQFISIKLNLERILHSKVDLISSNGLSPRIRPYIEKEKILVYEKQNQ
ncbi:MAG: nucleotidyltransferase domain-containing protein [Bacteroidota bacterium]